MNKGLATAILGVTLLVIILLAAACGGAVPVSTPTPSPTPTATERPTPTVVVDAAETHGSHLPLDAFVIKVEPLGHWHVLKPKKLLFTVIETATGQGKAGLSPVVQIARVGSQSVASRSLERDQIKDEGGGIYSLEYTPSDMDAYAFVFRFVYEGQEFVSAPIPAEVVRDGEEGIRVEANGTTYIYQIRYNWIPGHAHASDTDKVRMVFEIMRGIQEGANINWEQPFQNTFNHVVNADHPEVIVESADGKVKEELHPVYKGKGIYEAERLFSVAEVGDSMEYHIRFQFTDPYNGAKVTHPEPYKLNVSAPH